MKKILVLTVAFVIASASIFAQAKPAKKDTTQHAAAAVYTCPMHPEVVSSKPGKCPKCGMTLVKKETSPAKKTKMKKDSTMKM